jgi:hypothetical protein
MNAEEFMRDHAEKASTGRIAEIMGDLTPDAMAQLGPLVAGAPQPFNGNDVKTVREDGDDHIFDVTYTSNGTTAVSMRETVREVDGKWRIVKLEKPA